MNFDALVGKYAVDSKFSAVVKFYLHRRRLDAGDILINIFYNGTRISFSQIYPYIFYRKQISEKYGATIRFFQMERVLNDSTINIPTADIVLFQTRFDIEEDSLSNFLNRVISSNNHAKIGYIDSFAHSDIRLSYALDEHISYYIKKTIFHDKDNYYKKYNGGTNLTEYYSRLYNFRLDAIHWRSPRTIEGKLVKSPGFFTSPRFFSNFQSRQVPALEGRHINIHARFGLEGSRWYNSMRRDVLDRVHALNCPAVAMGSSVRWKQFMNELRRSKICISPFGYGEVCWRDIEAFQTGAVLVKPDMSHLETLPDLYVPYETYVPIRWDFADLEEAVELVLGDDALRQRLAYNAYRRIHDYISEQRFVDDISFLFK